MKKLLDKYKSYHINTLLTRSSSSLFPKLRVKRPPIFRWNWLNTHGAFCLKNYVFYTLSQVRCGEIDNVMQQKLTVSVTLQYSKRQGVKLWFCFQLQKNIFINSKTNNASLYIGWCQKQNIMFEAIKNNFR